MFKILSIVILLILISMLYLTGCIILTNKIESKELYKLCVENLEVTNKG